MPDMIYRPLGKTGLRVSIVGFGASPLGDEFGTSDPKEASRAVHYAIERGINYFDVAPYYGRGLAETRLGQALAGRRHEIVLATKIGRYDRADFDFSAGRIIRSVEESLARLQTDCIDLLQAHDVEYGRKKQILEETLPAMLRLKEAGKVRFVGITGYPLGILSEVAAAAPVDTILSYCRYNLLDTSLEETLAPLARERSIGLINASPLHMRLLADQGAPSWHPAPRRVVEAGRRVAEFCRRQGMDIADLAMQFALQYEGVATTLVGMSKVQHVDSNVRSVGQAPDPALLAVVRKMIEPVAGVVWKEGRPENDDPGAVEKQS